MVAMNHLGPCILLAKWVSRMEAYHSDEDLHTRVVTAQVQEYLASRSQLRVDPMLMAENISLDE